MTYEEKKKAGLADAEAYTHELEALYRIADRLLEKTTELCELTSTRHAITGPTGRDRIMNSVGPELDPYHGETISGVAGDLLDDITFLTKGLVHIMEEKYAYDL